MRTKAEGEAFRRQIVDLWNTANRDGYTVSMARIGERVGIPRNSVARQLWEARQAGWDVVQVSMSEAKRVGRGLRLPSAAELVGRYLAGESVNKLAAEFGCSRGAISLRIPKALRREPGRQPGRQPAQASRQG
jgi:biotin operon repressor